jgi:hypothetical protein
MARPSNYSPELQARAARPAAFAADVQVAQLRRR